MPALVALGEQFIRTTRYQAVLAENPAQMRTMAEHLIAGADSVIFVTEHEGQIAAMIGLVAYAHHLSGERVAGEVFFFVDPSARGTTGPRLIRLAETWAREHGARWLELIAPTERVGKLYERLHYVPIERTFQRAL